jgi:hypothetical protein
MWAYYDFGGVLNTRIRGCIQKFPDWPPEAYSSLPHRYFVSQTSEFHHHNPCVASQRVFVVVYFFMTQSGNFWIHLRNAKTLARPQAVCTKNVITYITCGTYHLSSAASVMLSRDLRLAVFIRSTSQISFAGIILKSTTKLLPTPFQTF